MLIGFDNQALACRERQYPDALFCSEFVESLFLLRMGRGAVIVEDDNPPDRDAVPELFRRGDFRRDAVHVDMQVGYPA